MVNLDSNFLFFSDINLLSFLIGGLFFGIFILLIWSNNDKKYIKIFSLSFLFFIFFICLFLLIKFDNSTLKFQFVTNFLWLNFLNINCMFGIDGISLFLVLLTTLLFPLCLLSSWHSIKYRVKEYLIC